MSRSIASCLLLCLFFANSRADTTVDVDAWARATPPGATSGAIYGRFANHSETPITIDQIELVQARHVMIHRTVVEQGVTRMIHEDVEIPPGGSVIFEPGGLHVMVMGLASPFVEGCRYPIKISWSHGIVTQHEFRTGGFGQSTAPADEGRTCLKPPQ